MATFDSTFSQFSWTCSFLLPNSSICLNLPASSFYAPTEKASHMWIEWNASGMVSFSDPNCTPKFLFHTVRVELSPSRTMPYCTWGKSAFRSQNAFVSDKHKFSLNSHARGIFTQSQSGRRDKAINFSWFEFNVLENCVRINPELLQCKFSLTWKERKSIFKEIKISTSIVRDNWINTRATAQRWRVEQFGSRIIHKFLHSCFLSDVTCTDEHVWSANNSFHVC